MIKRPTLVFLFSIKRTNEVTQMLFVAWKSKFIKKSTREFGLLVRDCAFWEIVLKKGLEK